MFVFSTVNLKIYCFESQLYGKRYIAYLPWRQPLCLYFGFARPLFLLQWDLPELFVYLRGVVKRLCSIVMKFILYEIISDSIASFTQSAEQSSSVYARML